MTKKKLLKLSLITLIIGLCVLAISNQGLCHRVKEMGRKSHKTEMKAV